MNILLYFLPFRVWANIWERLVRCLSKQATCKHFNINKLLLTLSRNTVLHPFKIEINKQRTDVNWYMNCSNISAFPPFFSIRESKTWFICCCCCNSTRVWLCWSFLSWSSSSLREWSNFAFSLRNSTASLLLFLFFFFTSTSPSAPHYLLLSPKRFMAFF